MWEFLQAYGLWIVFGLFFLLMMRMCGGGGGGCGMGHSHSDQDQQTGHQSHAELKPPEEANVAGGQDWAGEKDKTPAGPFGRVPLGPLDRAANNKTRGARQ